MLHNTIQLQLFERNIVENNCSIKPANNQQTFHIICSILYLYFNMSKCVLSLGIKLTFLLYKKTYSITCWFKIKNSGIWYYLSQFTEPTSGNWVLILFCAFHSFLFYSTSFVFDRRRTFLLKYLNYNVLFYVM